MIVRERTVGVAAQLIGRIRKENVESRSLGVDKKMVFECYSARPFFYRFIVFEGIGLS